MADRSEGRFNDVGRSNVRPVRGGEVVEREQFVAVASQAGGGLGVLVVVTLGPAVEGALGLLTEPEMFFQDPFAALQFGRCRLVDDSAPANHIDVVCYV